VGIHDLPEGGLEPRLGDEAVFVEVERLVESIVDDPAHVVGGVQVGPMWAGVAVRVRTSGAAPSARLTCFGVSDVPVTADVSGQLRAALDTTGPVPSRAALVGALAEHAGDIALDLVDTAGDGHASPAYRRRLISGLVAREVTGAYLKATRSESERGSR
jgi:hypothetical protein